MATEFWPSEDPKEPLPSERLAGYVYGQFMDAIQKEESEGIRDQESLNGTFIQRVPTDTQHTLLRGSRRIVLKPPHPNDLPGYFCEAFAVSLTEGARALPNREFMEVVDFYIIRDYVKGRPGPHYLVNGDGAHSVDPEDTIGSLQEMMEGATEISPFDTAELFFTKYRRYNMVAISE